MYRFTILCEISKGTFEISHKFWTHTPQSVHFTVMYFCVWVTISLNCDVISLSETGPWVSGVLQRSQSVYPTELVAAHPDSASDHLFYHDVGEIWWPQPIRLLKMGHVTGQGSTTNLIKTFWSILNCLPRIIMGILSVIFMKCVTEI